MMRRLASCVFLFALVVAGAGCASPRSNFYTLNSAAKPVATRADTSVSVGPVSVPAAVDRPQIVMRLGPNRVAIDEFHRWASPLPDAIARVVADRRPRGADDLAGGACVERFAGQQPDRNRLVRRPGVMRRDEENAEDHRNACCEKKPLLHLPPPVGQECP